MLTSLSAPLIAEMNSLQRHPATRATVERWLPEFTAKISGLSGGKLEQYAHGHTACLAPGADAGNDILFRARSGSFTNPQDGNLYVAVIKGADLDNPAGWESKWSAAVQSGLMFPAWTANSGAQYGAALTSVWTGSAFRVFYYHSNGYIYYRDYLTTGAASGGAVLVTTLGTNSLRLGTMQMAASSATELFVTLIGQTTDETLEDPVYGAVWQKYIYGSMIYRYYYNGSAWVVDGSFPYYTHAECALMRDSQYKYGGTGTGGGANVWGNGSANLITAQWGKRPCGGLAVNVIDTNTVVVSAGWTFYSRYGLTTHNQGVLSFIYTRDSAQWERGFEAGMSDYVSERLDFDCFARGSTYTDVVEGVSTKFNFLVWSRNAEPSDFDQLDTSQSIPRTREVVYARLSDDGKFLSQYQYLGPQDELTSAAFLRVKSAAAVYIYAIGWRSVYQSPPAALACVVPTPQDLELYATAWKTQVNNRWGMTIDFTIQDASVLFAPNSELQAGRLVKVYGGMTGDQVLIAQGLVDMVSPSLSLIQESHSAKVVARADKLLLDPRSEEMADTLPQQTLYIQPTDPIKNIGVHSGYWDVRPMEWPNLWFPGQYNHLQLANAYRLLSFPYANTGGDQGAGYPGMVLDQRAQHKGTWWNDVTWVGLSPMVDGSIQTSVRFGDMANKPANHFWARDGSHVYAELFRENGIIMGIKWHDGSGGPVFNPPEDVEPFIADTPYGVAQYSLMGGVCCHAADIGKKYSFVWESNSNFGKTQASVYAGSSHADDTWRKENFDQVSWGGLAVGSNRLYLIESDYDEADPLWATNKRWIHTAVRGGITATGLIPGYPAELKMIVLGGTIYCFYRPHHLYGSGPYLWHYAFQYEAARFGAGRFGIVGRGHAGVQWDSFFYKDDGPASHRTGRDIIPGWDNYVDFWDIIASDCVKDKTMEEAIKAHCWRGFTPTKFNSLVSMAGPLPITSATPQTFTPAVENLTIDFKMSVGAMGGEAGLIVRAVNQASPLSGLHTRIGLVVNGGLPGAGNQTTTYMVKRGYNGAGVELATSLDYSPYPLYLHNTWKIPIRITVRGNVYSMWIAGNYAGHFIDDTAGGPYFGLYANWAGADFYNVKVPELHEVPEISSIEVNQKALDALRQLLGKRAIKGVYQPNGAVKVSYYDAHDAGPTFQDSLTQNSVRMSDRFASIVRVDGAYTFATYASETLLKLGRRFVQEQLPDIFHREFCFREAKAIATRLAEEQVQNTFVGLPDLRVQPEDRVEIMVSQQSIAGYYLVDDVVITFQAGSDPDMDTSITTRRSVVI